MSDDFSIEVDRDDIDRIVKLGINAVKEAVRLTATDVWGNVRRESPVDEGRLAGSWDLQKINDLNYRIFTNVRYALFVSEGTGIFGPKASPIVPVSASVLVFDVGGETIFAKSVRGMKPNPYIDRALDSTSQRIGEFASMALRNVGAT